MDNRRRRVRTLSRIDTVVCIILCVLIVVNEILRLYFGETDPAQASITLLLACVLMSTTNLKMDFERECDELAYENSALVRRMGYLNDSVSLTKRSVMRLITEAQSEGDRIEELESDLDKLSVTIEELKSSLDDLDHRGQMNYSSLHDWIGEVEDMARNPY